MSTSEDSHPFHWRYSELDDKNFQVHGRSLLFVIILFSIILFIVLLGLYTRWVCRFRRLTTSTVMSSATSNPSAPPARSTGLDPTTIDSLPIFLHRSSATTIEEAQCSICLCTFLDQEKIKVLPECHHAFHPECIDKWLFTQSNCPLCRASLRSNSAIP